MYWINDNTLEADIEEGYYYLYCHFMPYFLPDWVSHIIVKNFHVYKDMDTTINMFSAQNVTTLNLLDENNELINPSELQGNNMSNL